MILGECLTECGYLTQIATMADAAEVVTDGPLLLLRGDEAIWVPLSSVHRPHAERLIIAKNNRPTAALVGIGRLQDIEDREENLSLLTLALVRTATDSGNRTDLDDFIAELGLTEEVANLADEEPEV